MNEPRIESERVAYRDGATDLEGVLAIDRSRPWPMPGVLVAHTFMGIVPFVEERARALAGLGFAAFALDVYGRDRRPRYREEAAAAMAPWRENPERLRQRARVALDWLRGHPACAGRKIAAIGYCFGGSVVLEMARAGLDLAGAVSFHGLLDTRLPARRGAVRAKVLALHGALDPLAGEDQTRAFREEMQAAGADWQLVVYGNAAHGFTNPGAGDDRASGLFYDEPAARRSWAAMRAFLAEVL